MLPALQRLDSIIQKCTTRTNAPAAGGLANITGARSSKLAGKVSHYAYKETPDKKLTDTTQITNGIKNGKVAIFFNNDDECEIRQELLTSCRPVVYAGAQGQAYYRVYDEEMIRNHYNNLRRENRELVDPATRLPVTNSLQPYNPGNFVPAYVQGTTVFPPWTPYTPPPQPAPPPMYYAPLPLPPREDFVNPLSQFTAAVNWRTAWRRAEDDTRHQMNDVRFSNTIKTRVLAAINHFFMSRDTDQADEEPDVRSNISQTYFLLIDMLGLHRLFSFHGENQPQPVDSILFRGAPGIEDDGIVFMRERPQDHNFMNGRRVLSESTYHKFFLYIFHAYFYTGITDQRIRVTRDDASSIILYHVPYVHAIDPLVTRTVLIEVRLLNDMEDTGRWLIRTVQPRATESGRELHMQQPYFSSLTGGGVSSEQAARELDEFMRRLITIRNDTEQERLITEISRRRRELEEAQANLQHLASERERLMAEAVVPENRRIGDGSDQR